MASKSTEKVFKLADAERKALAKIFREIRNQDSPIDSEIFKAKNRTLVLTIDDLKRHGFIRYPNWTFIDVSLSGVFALSEYRTRGTAPLIDASSKVYRHIWRSYITHPKQPITLGKISEQTKLSFERVLEALRLLKEENIYSGPGEMKESSDAITVSQSILQRKTLREHVLFNRDVIDYQLHSTDNFNIFSGSVAPKLEKHVSTALVDTDASELWDKALSRLPFDPAGAMTAARTLVETACKALLQERGLSYDEDADLPALYRATSKALELEPSAAGDNDLRQALSGCYSIVHGLSALRNRFGDAHGKSPGAARPSIRSAWLGIKGARLN